MTKKYGNEYAWCFLEENWDASKTIAIWLTLGSGEEEVIAHATDEYNAKQIVDALITADKVNDDPENRLNKHEIVFLQFVAAHCAEPHATMADNAIMWNNREVFNSLKAKFKDIY